MWKKVILLGLGLSVAILSTAVFLYCEAAYRPPLPYWVQRGQHMGKLAAKWPDDWDKQPLNMHPSWSEHEVHLLQEWDTYLQRADVYVLLKQKGTLPLMQRMHAEGKLSLAAHARQPPPPRCNNSSSWLHHRWMRASAWRMPCKNWHGC